MRDTLTRLSGLLGFSLLVCMGTMGWAHSDIVFYRSLENQITTHGETSGFPPERLFVAPFDFFGHPFGNPSFPKAFLGDDPGFDTNHNTVPPGHLAAPGNSILWLDFVSLNMPNVGRGNFFYWDALDPDEVSFQIAPPDHVMTIRDASGDESSKLDGSDLVVGPAAAGITNANGSLHQHILYRLDPRDETVTTDPVQGMYLFAMDLWMNGVTPSETVLVALWSPQVTAAARANAISWLRSNLEILTGDSLPGDFNGSGAYEIEDIDMLVAAVAAGTHDPFFDLTGSGLVTIDDIGEWLSIAGAALNPSGNPFLFGDANLDGVVDGPDFLTWNNHKFDIGAAWSRGDFNGDGVVDGADFLIWNNNKFLSANSAVPEPGAPLVWTSIIAVVCLRRPQGLLIR